jgi:hypothetical protein
MNFKRHERIKEIENSLEDYKELLEALQDIEMIYDNLNWVDINKPHHIDIELPRAIRSVENRIEVIESKLERI